MSQLSIKQKAATYAAKNKLIIEHLEPLIKAIDKKIESVYYTAVFGGEERVTVTYTNGYEKKCCVTADSDFALCRDVLKHLDK